MMLRLLRRRSFVAVVALLLLVFVVGVQYTASPKSKFRHQPAHSDLFASQKLLKSLDDGGDNGNSVHFHPAHGRQKADWPQQQESFDHFHHQFMEPKPVAGVFDGGEYGGGQALPSLSIFDNARRRADVLPPIEGEEVEDDGPPYIPNHRLIHFDLKGAPPKLDYLIKVLKLSKSLGATGVLVEYEDMFPFAGILASAAAGNHYNVSDVNTLLDVCQQLGLEVIPLVQTFGHMEFILKLEQFSHLRDVAEMPESICPCHDQTMSLIRTYIDQVMSIHKHVKYLHIGCDEVFHLGECAPCMSQGLTRSQIFVNHVKAVADYVRETYGVDVIIWDDMLRNFMPDEMEPLANIVQPMVWVYADDVYRFFPSYNWDKLSKVFDSVWTAGAFKGAHGPTLPVPPIEKHLTNTLNWLNVMKTEAGKFKKGFYGMVTTGWQRYDHFAVLCEILPVSIPSLVVQLVAMNHGYFNSSLKGDLYKGLDCPVGEAQSNLAAANNFKTFINLEDDPYLYHKLTWCFFPGSKAFQLTSQLDYVSNDVETYLKKTTSDEAWLTAYSVRRNYSTPFRINSLTEDLSSQIYSVTNLIKVAKQSLEEFFDDYTVAEWIEQRIYPLYNKLEELRETARQLSQRKFWSRRPLPVNSALATFGIGNGYTSVASQNNNPSVMKHSSVVRRSYSVEVGQEPDKSAVSSTQRPKRLVQAPDYYRNPPSVQIGA